MLNDIRFYDKGAETMNKYADKFIDLHLHLDGAVTVDIAKKLANAVEAAFTTDEVREELRKQLML